MKPHTVSLLHALLLIAVSAWGYFASATPSFTALIPAVFGLVLLGCYPGLKSENKAVAHVAVGVTALLALALFMPLKGALGRGDGLAIARVALMLLATIGALAAFVRAFIMARRSRA